MVRELGTGGELGVNALLGEGITPPCAMDPGPVYRGTQGGGMVSLCIARDTKMRVS